MAGVGSEKVFENDKVIVWNFTLEPGECTPLHTHEHNYMWYAIAGAPLQIYDEEGKDLGVFDVPTGGIFSLKPATSRCSPRLAKARACRQRTRLSMPGPPRTAKSSSNTNSPTITTMFVAAEHRRLSSARENS
jgi:hypothetical protein